MARYQVQLYELPPKAIYEATRPPLVAILRPSFSIECDGNADQAREAVRTRLLEYGYKDVRQVSHAPGNSFVAIVHSFA